MVNVDLYSAIITKVSNALDTLVSGEKPGFQTLSEGLVVLLCAEVVRQRVPDHGAVHSECSASDSGYSMYVCMYESTMFTKMHYPHNITYPFMTMTYPPNPS